MATVHTFAFDTLALNRVQLGIATAVRRIDGASGAVRALPVVGTVARTLARSFIHDTVDAAVLGQRAHAPSIGGLPVRSLARAAGARLLVKRAGLAAEALVAGALVALV